MIAFAAALIIAKVNVVHVKGDKTAWEKVKAIDWAGSVALVFCVSAVLGPSTTSSAR